MQRGGSGYPSAAIGIGAVYLAAKMLEYFAPPFGRLVKEQAELEGEYRFQQSRVITHAEEIAFYGGEKFEVVSGFGMACCQTESHCS